MVATRSNGRNLRSSGQPAGQSLSQVKAKKPTVKKPAAKGEIVKTQKSPADRETEHDAQDVGPMDSISGSQVPPPPTTRSSRRDRRDAEIPPVPSVVIQIPVRRRPQGPSRSTTIESASTAESRSNTIGPASRILPSSRTSATAGSPEPTIEQSGVLSVIREEEDEDEDNAEEDPGEHEEQVEAQHQEEDEDDQGDDEGQEEIQDQDQEDDQEEVQLPAQGSDEDEEEHPPRGYLEDDRDIADFSDTERPPQGRDDAADHRDLELDEDDEDEEQLEATKLSRLTRANDMAKTLRELARGPNPSGSRRKSGSKKKRTSEKAPAARPPPAKAPSKRKKQKADDKRAKRADTTREKKRSGHDSQHHDDDDDDDDDDNHNDDDEDDEQEQGYKPGPLPDWAQKRAEECYEVYYNEMLKIAEDAKKSPQLVFTHVNDIVPTRAREINPWNAYCSWYHKEGPDMKPEDWTAQEWTTYISEQYDNELAQRLSVEDRKDRQEVREAMKEFIEWQQERLAAYVEEAKSNPRKSSRLLQGIVTPFNQSAQRVWKEQGVHIFGFALPTRDNNRSMGQGLLWGGTPEFAAVKERLGSQVSRTLEDLTATFHILQMEQSENAGLVAHLYLQLPARDKETPKARLLRLLREFVRYDSLEACGTEVHLPSFVDKAFKHKLVLRNWPHKDIGIPGANGYRIASLPTRALQALVNPRVEFIRKTAENRLEDDDPCHIHLRVERWDEDDINATFMSQRHVGVVTNKKGKALVKAKETASWKKELLATEGVESEMETAASTGAAKGKGKGKGKAAAAPYPSDDSDDSDNDDDDVDDNNNADDNVAPGKGKAKAREVPVTTKKIPLYDEDEVEDEVELSVAPVAKTAATTVRTALAPATHPDVPAQKRVAVAPFHPPVPPINQTRTSQVRELSLPPPVSQFIGPRDSVPPPPSRPRPPIISRSSEAALDWRNIPHPHTSHLTIGQEFEMYQAEERAQEVRDAQEYAAWEKYGRDMEEYDRAWAQCLGDEEPPTKKRKLHDADLGTVESKERRPTKALPSRAHTPTPLPVAGSSRHPIERELPPPGSVTRAPAVQGRSLPSPRPGVPGSSRQLIQQQVPPRQPPQAAAVPGRSLPIPRHTDGSSRADRAVPGSSTPLARPHVPRMDFRALNSMEGSRKAKRSRSD
ncbi:hypothetical protein V5O48_010385 [Marasmius crinis-equi]|uniref:Uncharacterized protein n=1 Tax=Marasmius crinis-equi TaxID=585013 RepID=A0ABR3F8Y6_9AGAR